MPIVNLLRSCPNIILFQNLPRGSPKSTLGAQSKCDRSPKPPSCADPRCSTFILAMAFDHDVDADQPNDLSSHMPPQMYVDTTNSHRKELSARHSDQKSNGFLMIHRSG